jgi:hypothetical protein
MMQAMPDVRQQSFDEIYGPPENFLEIEVGFSSLGWIGPSVPCHGVWFFCPSPVLENRI